MRIVIIGAVLGGIAAAIEVTRHGYHDVTPGGCAGPPQ